MPKRLIALLTDFGTRDPFVGIMKGVIYARYPDACIVDLTHDIAPQAVVEGAFWLERSVPYFPSGTVFVAVVDPGVGTSRRGLVVRCGGHVFVAPDNGLVSGVFERTNDSAAFEIDAGRLGLANASATFHGRDVFAPVAADVAAGRLDIADVGGPVVSLCPSPLPGVRVTDDRIAGVVVTADRFGNLFTNIDEAMLRARGNTVVEAGGAILSMVRTYAEIAPNTCAALVNSFGVVEIARRDGNAEATLGLRPGDPVVVREKPGP